MITRFATVYPGHVDFPDMGQTATPANERRYGNEHLATVFAKTDAVARRMDELGYYAIWLAEHHFQHEGYECLPNLLMSAVHLAHITKQIKIGCGFNIAPMWHPLRLAEDYATADILTGGRVIFGVGRGYHTREVETFGAPMLDPEANRELFEEQVEIIFKAFNEESFKHHGKHYTLPPAVPRGAREDVRPARLRARDQAGPGRGRRAARWLGGRWRPQPRALHEDGRVVRRHARGVDRVFAKPPVALPRPPVRQREHEHGHARGRHARAAHLVRPRSHAEVQGVAMDHLTIGDASVVRIEEMVDSTFLAANFFMPFDPEALQPHLHWLAPRYYIPA